MVDLLTHDIPQSGEARTGRRLQEGPPPVSTTVHEPGPVLLAVNVGQPRVVDGPGGREAFARSGLTVRWPDGLASLLELAESCDVPADWSCRSGVCHRCQTPLIAGQVTYDPAPVDPPGPGAVLLCCARPDADLVLDL